MSPAEALALFKGVRDLPPVVLALAGASFLVVAASAALTKRPLLRWAAAALPSSVLVAGAWAAGAPAAVAAATNVPLLIRRSMLGEVFSRGTKTACVAAMLAAAVFALCALVFSLKARGEPEPPTSALRRSIGVLLGGGLVAGAGFALPRVSPGIEVPWLCGAPAVLGVLGIGLGTAGLSQDDEAARSRSFGDLVIVCVLTAAAVLSFGVSGALQPIFAHFAPIDLSDPRVVAPSLDDLLTELESARRAAHFGAVFAAAPLVALAIAVPMRVVREIELLPSAGIAVSMAAALLVPAAGVVTLRDASAAVLRIRDFEPLAPAGFTFPRAPRGGPGCDDLVEDELLYVGRERVHRGRIDLGPATMLDSPQGCAEVAREHAARWVTADGAGTFGRLACLLGALTAAQQDRALTPLPAGSRRYVALGARPRECEIVWVSRRADPEVDGTLDCTPWVLATPRCIDHCEGTEPEPYFEVVAVAGRELAIARRQGPATLWKATAPRPSSGATELRFAELASTVGSQWDAAGAHKDPSDRRFDLAVVRASPETSMRELEAMAAALRERTREVKHVDDSTNRPVFDVTFAPLAPPPKPPEDAPEPAAKSSLKLRLASIDVPAAIDKKAVETFVDQRLGAVNACADAHLPVEGPRKMDLEVRFFVDAEARVWFVRVDGVGDASKLLGRCVAEQLEGRSVAGAGGSGRVSAQLGARPKEAD